MTLTVVVADDNPVVRAGLTSLLEGRRPDIRVVAEAPDGGTALEVTRRTRPDVVLLDVRMPVLDGLTALPHLARLAPVLMLTYSGESEVVQEALRLGAGGYLVHGEFTAEELVTAVHDVRAGRAHFTPTAANALVGVVRATAHDDGSARSAGALQFGRMPSHVQRNVGQFGLSGREAEVMDLIASGLNNRQIADTCFISEKTVKNHINRIFAKLHSTTRSEAIAAWLGTRTLT
ncbi:MULTISPECIES: response regulator [Streptomyces]|uniref:response regulator n=1 Tax=Streptomyces TaxID=1883 RepID=UPI0013183BAD|nr:MULTISPECIES: response regulator transcription factor [Streptomyces]QGZ50707.1 response regulator [Streptomyces sp. QHH-9511]GGT83255.1 DNA-binding response regulator [Streptomyces lateritius]